MQNESTGFLESLRGGQARCRAISKLGPVYTPGHPLIGCGCRDIENSSLLDRAFSEFGLKNEKSPVLAKKIQKNSAAMFSIRYWSAASSWELLDTAGSAPIRDTRPRTRPVPAIPAMSALPPKADIGTQSRNVRFVPIAEVE
jgi:hypothetical protein